MTKSTHECIVVELNPIKHPDADKLSLVLIGDYAQAIINTEQWQGKSKAVFIPGQNYVPVNREEFSFMKTKEGQEWALVKHCKLRGVRSDGILIPVPNDTPVGEDWAERLGVKHKEDEESFESEKFAGDRVSGPSGLVITKYDIDGPKDHLSCFIEGEEVVATLKVHGTNSKFLYHEGQQFIGGRTQWQKLDNTTVYSTCFAQHPSIQAFCEANQDLILWGEVYNCQGKYNYGLPPKNYGFAAFDITTKVGGEYLNFDHFMELCAKHAVPISPVVYRGPFSKDKMLELAENPPALLGGNHVQEGIVIKPVVERKNRRLHRLVYKLISPNYK